MSLTNLFKGKNKKPSMNPGNNDQLFQTAKNLPDLIDSHKIEELNGIPLIITEEHHHVFPFWQASNIKNVTLVHIDSHSDLGDGVPIDDSVKNDRQPSLDYYKKMHIGQFILPAVHYGVVKDMIWISPFQKGTNIHAQYINQGRLKVKPDFSGKIFWENSFEDDGEGISLFGNENKRRYGLSLKPKELKQFLQTDYILDIDLDAFAKKFYGHRDILEIIYSSNPLVGVEGWEQRIKETFCLLESLPRPNLITVTRSQGKEPYVPQDVLEKVQAETLIALRKIYS